jgi:uncharacterized membrane protein
MKYTSEIEIDLGIDRVIELFDDPKNLPKWMIGLESFEHISGRPGQVGAKSLLKFKMGKREFEMIETVTVRNLPDEFTGTYELKGVYNIVKNKFIRISDSKTKYLTEQEYQFSGFMKIIGFLMPTAFKKQSMQYLIDFKKFVENT